MKQRYTELLPSYLEGSNISGHAGIIDNSTDVLYNLLGLLESWSNLTRPLLIEKKQEARFTAEYTVHVDIPYAIKSISITGDYNASLSFAEEDVITTQSINFTLTDSDVEEHQDSRITSLGIVNAELLVIVETYEGYTYTKAYPENDTIKGDVHDHDSLLDKLGNVLTVPRRIYSEYRMYDAQTKSTVPSWFGKRVENIKGHNTILSCTEDDYYYAERLNNFIQDYMVEGLSIEKSKLRAVYNATVTEEINYNTLVCRMDVDDFDEKNMAGDNTSEANTYVYKVGLPEYINLPVPAVENLSEFLADYVSLTKNILVLEDTSTYVELVSELLPVYYAGESVSIQVRVTDINDKPLPNMRVNARLGPRSNGSSGYTDENGIFTFNKTLSANSTGEGFTVTVYDQLPYSGTVETFTTSVVLPESIPITCHVEVLSASTTGVSFNAEFQDEEGDPFTCDGSITLLYNQMILDQQEIHEDTGATLTTGDTLTWQEGHTYLFRVGNNVTSPAPRGYKYTTEMVYVNVTIPGASVLLPVSLDATVLSATTGGVSVDVDFLNTSTSQSLSLDGTITLSINDGTSTTLLDTESLSNTSTVTLESPTGTTFTDGTYTLLLELNATNPPTGYYYDNPITDSETITISSGTIIDCTTTDAWLSNNLFHSVSANLNNNGYITNTNTNGTEYLTALNTLILQKNMTIQATINKTTGNYGFGIIQLITGGYNQFYITNNTLTEKHNGTSNTTSVTSLPNTTSIFIEIDNNGYITIEDGTNTYTSNTAYTDAELAMMTLAWQHGSDKSFSITHLVYNCDSINNTHVYDWCTTLNNWTSTSGSTYPPTVATEQGLTCVKAPQGTRNVSYHMSYFTEALRLDEDIVIRCEVDIGGLQNLFELGIITKDVINNPYQYRTWAVLFITNSDRKIDNLNGNAVSCGTPYTNTWFPFYFRIKNRSITVIFGDNNNSVGSYTTTVNTVTSDDTKNNRCYLGMHSAEGSYPLAGMRCVSIVKLNS